LQNDVNHVPVGYFIR